MKRLKKNKPYWEKEWMILVIFLKKRNKVFWKRKRIGMLWLTKILLPIEKMDYALLDLLMWEKLIFYLIIVAHMAIGKESFMWNEMWSWEWNPFEYWKTQLTPMDPRINGCQKWALLCRYPRRNWSKWNLKDGTKCYLESKSQLGWKIEKVWKNKRCKWKIRAWWFGKEKDMDFSSTKLNFALWST